MTDEQGTQGVPRRRWLAASGSALAGALAGCLGDDSDDTEGDGSADGGPTDDDGDSEGDGGNGGDNGGDNGDDNGGENGGDNGDDSGENGGNDGRENGTDNGQDNGGDDTPEEPAGAASIDALQVGDQTEEAVLGVGDEAPVTATVVSEEAEPRELAVILQVTPAGHDNPVYTDGRTVALDAGETGEVLFSGVTSELGDGSYDITVQTATESASLGLSVFERVTLNVKVYTQVVDPEYRAETGVVTLREGDTVIDEVAFTSDTDPVTLDVLRDGTANYTIDVTNINEGVVPDISYDFTFLGEDFEDGDDLPLAATGYEFQDTDSSLRFTAFINDEDGGPNGERYENIMYGTYAANGNYHIYYADGTTYPEPGFTLGDSPPEYGADLQQLANELGRTPPSHSLDVDTAGELYFHPGTRNRWEPGTNAVNRNRVSHNFGRFGAARMTQLNPDEIQFAGEDQLRGTDVHLYDIPQFNSTVYVDTNTGYVIRFEGYDLGSDNPNSFEVVEFFEFDQHDTVDWDLIKNRSNHETGENLDDEELDELPWERHEELAE